MGININGAFLREELVDGSVGMNYPEKTREIFAGLTDEQFEDIVNQEFNDPDTRLNALLDQIVTILANRTSRMIEPNSKRIVFDALILGRLGTKEKAILAPKKSAWVPSELDLTKALEIAEIEQSSDVDSELPALITEPHEEINALFRSNTSSVPGALRTAHFDGELLTAGIWIQHPNDENEAG